MWLIFFFFNDTATTEIYTLSLHDALPIFRAAGLAGRGAGARHDQDQRGLRLRGAEAARADRRAVDRHPGRPLRRDGVRSEEHTSELQSRQYLVCRLLLEKKTTQRQRLPHL